MKKLLLLSIFFIGCNSQTVFQDDLCKVTAIVECTNQYKQNYDYIVTFNCNKSGTTTYLFTKQQYTIGETKHLYHKENNK